MHIQFTKVLTFKQLSGGVSNLHSCTFDTDNEGVSWFQTKPEPNNELKKHLSKPVCCSSDSSLDACKRDWFQILILNNMSSSFGNTFVKAV